MTFPDDPLDLRAELLLNGTWTDISAYLDHGPIAIGRGHPDESTTTSPSTLAMTLTNNDARFTSTNPVSPYYPYLMRNVQCRISIPAQAGGRDYRGFFEVPEWPQKQDASGSTITVAAAGGGLLRRLGQRNNPLNSVMYRAYVRAPASLNLAGYWPMEDGAGATLIASALGGPAMTWFGTPTLASNSDFACSGPLPVLNGASFTAVVPADTGVTWTANVVRFLMEVPSGGESAANNRTIARVYTTGTTRRADLDYGTGGTLNLTGYDGSGSQLWTTGAAAFAVDGELLRVSIELNTTQPGVAVVQPGQEGTYENTSYSGTVGAVTKVVLNPAGKLTQTVMGHLSVQGYEDSIYTMSAPLNAWNGETAGNRFSRLCTEENVAFTGTGDLDITAVMGDQTAETLTQLLQECADADRGVWTELRDQLGWGYTTRTALYNLDAQVTADYNDDMLGEWASDPLEDDQTTVNDVTLTQTTSGTDGTGSSSRQFAAPGQPVPGGRLSTLDPPDGMGTYDQAYDVNLADAGDLDSLASWIVHVGTVDEPRYPGIVFDLTDRDLAALYWDIVGMDLGDRLLIDNPPAWLGPNPVSQLVQGIQETLWYDTHTIEVNGVPESPYEVAVIGTMKVDTAGSQLHANITSTATTFEGSPSAGSSSLWTTDSGQMPFDIRMGGERMTVTAISSTSAPQTFTVTRSVNGVVKAQTAGESFALWDTPVVAL